MLSQTTCPPSVTTSLTDALVARCRAVQLTDLPDDVVAVARHCVLDFLGVCIAGRLEPCAALLADALCDAGGSSSVVGRSARSPAPVAAFINAAAAHALDYDDTHTGMRGHPTAPVFAAVLALAEARQLPGDAALQALVAGVEAECLLGEMLGTGHYERGWHATATLGTFGAALGCCTLLKLDDSQCANAIGLAATQASGLRRSFGTMAKPIQVGAAARAGLEAAVLSAAGVTGPEHALEGDGGFASLHGASLVRSSEVATDLDHWRLPDTRFKYHASCFLTHSAIEAARLIAASANGRVERIERVDVLVSPTAAEVCDRAAPQDGLEAKFSLQATVAMALLGIETADPGSFHEATLRVPGLAELMARIHVEVDERASLTATRLRARSGDGSVTGRDWDADRPEPDLATQREQLQRKFNTLVMTTLAPDQARRMIDDVERLAELQTLAPIGAGLRVGGQPNPD